MVILFTFWYILGWQFPTWLWVLSGIFFSLKLRRSVNRIISGIKGELVKRAVDSGELPSEETKVYLENRNKNNVCIIGIESVPAIENLENILKVQGIDAIFVGPNDLTITLGVPDQYDHPDYEAALREIISKSSAANVPVLIHHQTVELTQKWLKEGSRFVLYSSDARTMHNGYREEFGEIKKVGAELGGQKLGDIGESEEVI